MLNNTKVKRLKAKDKMYRELDYGGLYIEVKTNGKKFWRYRYVKSNGKETMKSLGEYPEVDIDKARALRDTFKKDESYSSQEGSKVSEVAEKWLAWKNYPQQNHELIKRRIATYINPVIGNTSINHVKPKDILPILKRIEAKGHLDLAKRIQQILSGIFKYGILNLLCETNPAYMLSGATRSPVVRHYSAVTTQKDFKDILNRVDSGELMRVPAIKIALQLQPYIFLRSENMRSIKPGDVDFEKRVINIPKTKNARKLIVPLCDSALEIVEQAFEMTDGFYLFSGISLGGMISEGSLNKRLRNYGIGKDRHVFHGYRTTFSTLAREVLRLEGDLIETQLDHVVKSRVQAAYDRSERLEERFEMMQIWGEYVDSLRKKG